MRRPAPSLNPFQVIAMTFLLGIVLGTVLLSMPFSAAPGQQVTLVQAIFTATSALCITGLSVVDISKTFSLPGQLVILLLIQAGGIGILTFGTAFAVFLGKRLGVEERLRLATQLSVLETGEVTKVLRRIIKYVLVAELAGTLLLYVHFFPLEGPVRGLYFALFHAVSAYNHAGFALYSDSLMRFSGDLYFNLVIVGLVLLGGMGFLVQVGVLLYLRNPRQHRMSLNTWICLWTPAVLLLLGFVAILLFEWSNPRTLGGLAWEDRLMAAFFQSATPRSAGLNTIDYGGMEYSTLLLTIMLMFVGANPGSTGGGIKTTTFFVLVTSVWNMVRGRGEMVAFRRRIHHETVLRAGVVAVMTLSVIVVALMLLTLSEQQALDAGELSFVQLIFEVFSAACTVGLSMNATATFSEAGQLILAFLMYVGRLGPLSFAIALSTREHRGLVHYPADKNILIG